VSDTPTLMMISQDEPVRALLDGPTNVIIDSSNSAPAANTFIPHEGASSDAIDGRSAMARGMTGRGYGDVNTVITRAQPMG